MLKVFSFLTVKELMTKIELLSKYDRDLIANQPLISANHHIQLPFESQNKPKKFAKHIKIAKFTAKYFGTLKFFVDDGDYFTYEQSKSFTDMVVNLPQRFDNYQLSITFVNHKPF